MEFGKIVKEKRFWVASFLLAWAAALQVTLSLSLSISESLHLPFCGLQKDLIKDHSCGHFLV